tara:strand:+ start:390 stop:710 length:321 start_codon:yes stop_codon:yes gene_type:complete
LGGIGGTVGVLLRIIRKHKQHNVRTGSMLLFLMCLLSCTGVELVFGWQNFDLAAGNDYSTGLNNPPQYKLTKTQRLKVQKVSKVWSFVDIHHKVLKSDTETLVLSL